MRVNDDTVDASAGGSDLRTADATALQPRVFSPLDLIEVRAPYCALRDVRSSQPGDATASVHPELPMDMEAGPVCAAEAGRHMAILGSVACATHKRESGKRLYYLAERALLQAPDISEADGAASLLHVSARCVESRTRVAQAACELRQTDGTLLFGLGVTYKLVPEDVFQRLFAAYRVDMRGSPRRAHDTSHAAYHPQRRSPYRQRIPLTLSSLDARHIRTELNQIPAEACAGHFPLYPALPVAVLMEAFANSTGMLLRSFRDNPELRFRVTSADITASRLVFAGQSLVIEGEVVGELSEHKVEMRMRASLSGGDEVSRATFVTTVAASHSVAQHARVSTGTLQELA